MALSNAYRNPRRAAIEAQARAAAQAARTITTGQYDMLCNVIDAAKADDKSLCTDDYALGVLVALNLRVEGSR